MVVEHSHFSLGQKLLDDCRVVSKSVCVYVVNMSKMRGTHNLKIEWQEEAPNFTSFSSATVLSNFGPL